MREGVNVGLFQSFGTKHFVQSLKCLRSIKSGYSELQLYNFVYIGTKEKVKYFRKGERERGEGGAERMEKERKQDR